MVRGWSICSVEKLMDQSCFSPEMKWLWERGLTRTSDTSRQFVKRWRQAFHCGAGGRTRGYGCKLKQENFSLDVRRKTPPLRTGRNRSSRGIRFPERLGSLHPSKYFKI